MINEAYGNVTPEELHGLHERIDPDTTGIGKVLARIPNDILPEADKQHLEQLVTNINLDKEKVTDTKVQIEVHFLTKLVRLYNNQKVAEQALSNFEDVCKHYLIGKSLKYNSDSFEAAIYEDIHGSKIDLPFLSSGEKQIVSLFSYLYLSGNQNYFVVIDEPELSLSVPWQRRFLPDIVKCCNGLIAVTHSPFVYDNELKPYVHALDEFFVPFEPSPELDEEQDPIDESLIFIGDD